MELYFPIALKAAFYVGYTDEEKHALLWPTALWRLESHHPRNYRHHVFRSSQSKALYSEAKYTTSARATVHIV